VCGDCGWHNSADFTAFRLFLTLLRHTEYACYNAAMATNEENLARVTSVRTEMEGSVIVSGLEDRGIKATMSGVYTTNFRAEAPGWVEVLVAEHDLAHAQEALVEIQAENDHIDWSQVDVGQPEDT
jgi:hypothetical protein